MYAKFNRYSISGIAKILFYFIKVMEVFQSFTTFSISLIYHLYRFWYCVKDNTQWVFITYFLCVSDTIPLFISPVPAFRVNFPKENCYSKGDSAFPCTGSHFQQIHFIFCQFSPIITLLNHFIGGLPLAPPLVLWT